MKSLCESTADSEHCSDSDRRKHAAWFEALFIVGCSNRKLAKLLVMACLLLPLLHPPRGSKGLFPSFCRMCEVFSLVAPRSIEEAPRKAEDMFHVSPAGACAVMRLKGNFGRVACIEFVFPWHCNPRGVLLLGSTGNTSVTRTCLAQGKGAPLSRGCCRLPLGSVSVSPSGCIGSVAFCCLALCACSLSF